MFYSRQTKTINIWHDNFVKMEDLTRMKISCEILPETWKRTNNLLDNYLIRLHDNSKQISLI